MLDLKDKRILIIMPKFYTYQEEMKKDLDSRGAISFFYDEEPPKVEYLIRKNIAAFTKQNNLYEAFNKRLVDKIESEVGQCDYMLVIRGNVLEPATIEKLKREVLREDGKCVYYSWDSIARSSNQERVAACFERKLSFDSRDVEDYPGYELLPLFYRDDFSVEEEDAEDYVKVFDYVSIQSFTPFRYACMKAFKEANPDKNMFIKLYLNKSVYQAKRIKEPGLFKHLDMDLITFEPYSPSRIRELCLQSKAVIDITHEAQRGLTMRTMEMLGLRCKLVTNNSFIKKYEFYNSKNYYVLEDITLENIASENFEPFRLPDAKWLNASYKNMEKIRAKYSIHAWLDNLLK